MRSVPVSMGSPRFRTREVDGFLVSEVWFPAGLRLPPHVHERPVIGVMLDGSFDQVFPRRSCDCPPATVLTEPAGEKHGNRIRDAGAHLLVVQPDPARVELLRPLRELVERVHNFHHPGIAGIAGRLTRELRARDEVAPLALESGVLEMLAIATRTGATGGSGTPRWLRRAREIVEDRFRGPLRVGDVADEVGIHRAHLSRAFHGRYGEPIGDYVRRRRLEWATARITATDEPLAVIATRAGFSDQSHLTRAFKARMGVTPYDYRRRAGLAGLEDESGPSGRGNRP